MNKKETVLQGWYAPVTMENKDGERMRNENLGEQFDRTFTRDECHGTISELDVEPIYEWKEQRGFIVYPTAFDAALAGRRPVLTGIHQVEIFGDVVESKQWPGRFIGTKRKIIQPYFVHPWWQYSLDEVVYRAVTLLYANGKWTVPGGLIKYLDSEDGFSISDPSFKYDLCDREKALKALQRLSLYMRDPVIFSQHLEADARIAIAYELVSALPDKNDLQMFKRYFERRLT